MAKEKDRLLDAWSDIRQEFEDEYGPFGDKLKSEEVLKKEKESGSKHWYTPSELPKNNELRIRYEKAWKELRKYEIKMFKYQNKCKNEFMEMFKKYFWNLWD